ncbi:MAG TPA: glycoside hydrolase family 130 protein [Byssovorax sp.]|jgi:predicted GH43/DUF377 family glycosyl hydrolase
MPPLHVTRTAAFLSPDPRRVISKRFVPGENRSADGRTHEARLVARILAMSEPVVEATLSDTRRRFGARHLDLDGVLEASFASVAGRIDHADALSRERRSLIGAYFTHEYSVEAAALTNPSMVAAPDQGDLPPSRHRFVMSLRAIGEGHISSIEFRSGVIDVNGHVEMDAPSPYATIPQRRAPTYEKALFRRKLVELRAFDDVEAAVLDALPDRFSLADLEAVIRKADRGSDTPASATHATRTMHWLATSNYETAFAEDSKLSERVLFPGGPRESHGMEDARFVRFTDDDGRVVYFATYTAYDGYEILPQLIETSDFVSFRMATLNGACAKNKGMALFPRKIGGSYVALSRLDNENNLVMTSDNVHFWQEAQRIQEPASPWELVQLGNSGSPLETDAGWLVLTHGVGPLRQYAIGAILLDKDDPTRVLGHLDEPLLAAQGDERDGYVPNVVYSCGSMLFGGMLVIPFGVGDVATRIATVPLDDVLARLTR